MSMSTSRMDRLDFGVPSTTSPFTTTRLRVMLTVRPSQSMSDQRSANSSPLRAPVSSPSAHSACQRSSRVESRNRAAWSGSQCLPSASSGLCLGRRSLGIRSVEFTWSSSSSTAWPSAERSNTCTDWMVRVPSGLPTSFGPVAAARTFAALVGRPPWRRKWSCPCGGRNRPWTSSCGSRPCMCRRWNWAVQVESRL
jgi:hypothetical protein